MTSDNAKHGKNAAADNSKTLGPDRPTAAARRPPPGSCDTFVSNLETLERLMGALSGGIVVASADGSFLHFSDEARRILGLGPIDAPPETWAGEYGLYRDDGTTPIPVGESPLERAMAGEDVGATTVLVRNREKPGTVHCTAAATPLRSPEGQVIGGVVVFLDRSDSVNAHAALAESNDELDAVIRTAVDAIISIDHKGTVKSFNPAATRMFGYEPTEVIGKNVSMLMPSPMREEHGGYIKRYLETGERRVIGIGRDVHALRKDGSVFAASIAVSEIDSRRVFTGFIRDMSEIRRLEKQVLEAVSEEQRRIGMELHDKTQQELAGLGMMAEHLRGLLVKEGGDTAAIAEKLASGLAEAAQGVRLISRGILPVQLDAEGLMDALHHLATETSDASGVRCQFRALRAVRMSGNFAATHLYRIAQEAVNNALKHARAELIVITLDTDGKSITLQVRDNGVGITQERGSSVGLGLRTMRYRAGLIDATLQIDSDESYGSTLVCKVPVHLEPG